jgi:hypothetical protein
MSKIIISVETPVVLSDVVSITNIFITTTGPKGITGRKMEVVAEEPSQVCGDVAVIDL